MSHRDDVIKGLRMLADFIEDNPDFPIPTHPSFPHVVSTDNDTAGVAEIERIAHLLGAQVECDALVEWKFGGLTYRATYASHASMERYRRVQAAGEAAVKADEMAAAGAR